MNSQLALSHAEQEFWLHAELHPSLLAAPLPPDNEKIDVYRSPLLRRFSTAATGWLGKKPLQKPSPKRTLIPIFELLIATQDTLKACPIPRPLSSFNRLRQGKGILRETPEHFVYLELSPQFPASLLPDRITRPPYIAFLHGAHIPVASSRESYFQGVEFLPELGKEFSFELEGFFSVKAPDSWLDVEEIWFFTAKSPELEKLRQSRLLPALPGGHPFVIAIATKPRKRKQPITPTLYRISPAATPA